MTSKEEKQNAKERLDLRDALEFKVVRDVLWRFIGKTGIFSITGAMPTEQANYYAGKRDLGIEWIELIEEAGPDLWLAMQNEQLEVNDE